MRKGARVAVVIPALNEERAIGLVLDALPEWVDQIVVADNGSRDGTVRIVQEKGALVVIEPRRGYGSACLRGIAALGPTDIVVFLDGDYSDYPEQMDRLVDPIVDNEADLVIGSRTLGDIEPGALALPARFGNRLACFLIGLFWGTRFTDLGPFRAIRKTTLDVLAMRDPDYGWTVEMQIKAVLCGARCLEVPVNYRKRIGESKVSGTIWGIVGAGYKILGIIFVSAAKQYLISPGTTLPRRLVVFTRYPEPGKVKTRLIPVLGADGAADFHRRMAEHVLAQARRVPNVRVEVRYTGAEGAAMRAWLGGDLAFAPQCEGDLGARMARSFDDAFGQGAGRVVIIGTDTPEITPRILERAFGALSRHDLVIGPATDGGYYLIGLGRRAWKKAVPRLFENMAWSTEHVCAETISRAAAERLRVWTLAPLDDVDRPEDLDAWERAAGTQRPCPVSVIVPALNEAQYIAETVRRAKDDPRAEVIVVDGGSEDGTPEIAREAGATVYAARRGRAAQMNFGSAKASGDVLLFVHADTLLPGGFVDSVQAALERRGVIAGAFHLQPEDPRFAMRWIAWWANRRARWFGMPYGDQGLFLRKDTFRELGGFRDLPIMEDFEIIRRLRRRGRIAIVPATVVTSTRRWRRVGPWRTVLYNQLAVAAYLLGVPAEHIARAYAAARGNARAGRR